jgi:hypothetical protein
MKIQMEEEKDEVLLTINFVYYTMSLAPPCSNDNETDLGIEVDDHDGKFIETETIIDRYQLRPLIIALMCLIEFAMLYTLLGPRESKKFKEKYKTPYIYLHSITLYRRILGSTSGSGGQQDMEEFLRILLLELESPNSS